MTLFDPAIKVESFVQIGLVLLVNVDGQQGIVTEVRVGVDALHFLFYWETEEVC